MTNIPPEAAKAIKFTRADAVKQVAQAISELSFDDVMKCQKKVHQAATEFREAVCLEAYNFWHDELATVARMVGVNVESLHRMTSFAVYPEEDPGNTVQVIFSDGEKSFSSRFRVEVTTSIIPDLLQNWVVALAALEAAKVRDFRVSAMKKEAREALIKNALGSTPEGLSVAAAVRSLAAVLKAQM